MAETFDSSQVPCTCVLEDADWGLQALEVLQISRAGALLNTSLLFARDARYEAILKLTAGPSFVLNGQVSGSGQEGLRLRWRFGIPEEADRLEAALRDCAIPKEKAANGAEQAARRASDGSIDIGATLLSRARTVRADELAVRKRTVRMLNMSTVAALIHEAVNEAVSHLGHAWEEKDKDRLRVEAEEIFTERLEELKAEKADMETRATALREQLARAQALLDEERMKIVSADQFTMSDAGLIELERRLERMLERVIRAGSVTPELEADMRAVVARLLDEEREKIRQRAGEAHSDVITLLERKVERLARSLEDTQSERDLARRRAHALELASGNIGFANIYLPGLAGDDPFRDLKLELLRALVEDNKELREQIRENGSSKIPDNSFAPQAAGAKDSAAKHS